MLIKKMKLEVVIGNTYVNKNNDNFKFIDMDKSWTGMKRVKNYLFVFVFYKTKWSVAVHLSLCSKMQSMTCLNINDQNHAKEKNTGTDLKI